MDFKLDSDTAETFRFFVGPDLILSARMGPGAQGRGSYWVVYALDSRGNELGELGAFEYIASMHAAIPCLIEIARLRMRKG